MVHMEHKITAFVETNLLLGIMLSIYPISPALSNCKGKGIMVKIMNCIYVWCDLKPLVYYELCVLL